MQKKLEKAIKICDHFTQGGKRIDVQIRKAGEEYGEILQAEYIYARNKTDENKKALLYELADGKIIKWQLRQHYLSQTELPTTVYYAFSTLQRVAEMVMTSHNITHEELLPYIDEKLNRTLKIIEFIEETGLDYDSAKEVILGFEKVTSEFEDYEQ